MQSTIYANKSELSTAFPRPLPIPQAHKITALVIATPIKAASTLDISGNWRTRHRKYTELEMTLAERTRSAIYDVELVYDLTDSRWVDFRKKKPTIRKLLTIQVSPLSPRLTSHRVI
jgi:hypothetical protein